MSEVYATEIHTPICANCHKTQSGTFVALGARGWRLHHHDTMGRPVFYCSDECSDACERTKPAGLVVPSPETWPRPVPVSERLPEEYPVLAYGECCGCHATWHLACKRQYRDCIEPFVTFDDRQDTVAATHWLPLPPSPTE